MRCVSTPSISILRNGEVSSLFSPLRGLRQGDHLSPSLFIICFSGLFALISIYQCNQVWKGLHFGLDAP